MFISDHGQVPQAPCSSTLLEDTEQIDGLAYATGGAGRALYLYPEQGKEPEVRRWLEQHGQQSGAAL
ncbi:MAG: hypothetical protein EBU42_11600 [Synechococcus sp.]|nr:hypothetical protein [Synechococcus sp.]